MAPTSRHGGGSPRGGTESVAHAFRECVDDPVRGVRRLATSHAAMQVQRWAMLSYETAKNNVGAVWRKYQSGELFSAPTFESVKMGSCMTLPHSLLSLIPTTLSYSPNTLIPSTLSRSFPVILFSPQPPPTLPIRPSPPRISCSLSPFPPPPFPLFLPFPPCYPFSHQIRP
ncbi:unnamed protein product [Closterium sp. NIES-65]|nr:unnamed protein product [Closterium sp. NIES-65]